MGPKPEENHVEVASKEQDAAAHTVDGATAVAITPEQDRRVLRKIDLFFMPLILVTFGLQYTDKIILNGTAQYGIIEDLNLFEVVGYDPVTSKPIISLHRFSLATLIFYWGFLAGTIPAAILALKLPIGKFLSGTVIAWGVITVLTVTVKDYASMLVLRFFLGVTEAAVGPGFAVLITMYWKKQEQPLRYSVWYTATGLGGFFGSLTLYGIGHIQGPLAQWKYPYIILGSLTIAWGLLLFAILPDSPSTAWFLSADDRAVAVERMRAELTGIENKTFKWRQARETAADPKTWFILLMSFCLHFVNGAISGFGTIIVQGFGFDGLTSILINGGVGAVVFVVLVIVGTIGTLVKQSRLIMYCLCEVPVVIGAALVWRVPWDVNRAAAIGGFLILGFFAASYTMLLSVVGANTAGHTKKVLTQGVLWSTYAVCNGVAPLFVRQTEVGQQYPAMFQGVIVTASISCATGFALRLYLQRQNKTRDRVYGAVGDDGLHNAEFLDETDGDNKRFRYSL